MTDPDHPLELSPETIAEMVDQATDRIAAYLEELPDQPASDTGGFFALTERGGARLAGLERCDSVALDPHKGLFLPYGTGAIVLRDGAALSRTYAADADYIPDPDEPSQVVDFAGLGPELSRDVRGLRVWLPLKMHGIEPFRAQLDEKLDLAERAADHLRRLDDIHLVAEPQLSTLAFRVEPDGAAEVEPAELDDLNRRILQAVNDRGRVHLSGTRLDGRFTLRISVLSFRTHAEHLDRALEDVEAAITREP
jgi:aromatic-L-amino-acid decarboxylase